MGVNRYYYEIIFNSRRKYNQLEKKIAIIKNKINDCKKLIDENKNYSFLKKTIYYMDIKRQNERCEREIQSLEKILQPINDEFNQIIGCKPQKPLITTMLLQLLGYFFQPTDSALLDYGEKYMWFQPSDKIIQDAHKYQFSEFMKLVENFNY